MLLTKKLGWHLIEQVFILNYFYNTVSIIDHQYSFLFDMISTDHFCNTKFVIFFFKWQDRMSYCDRYASKIRDGMCYPHNWNCSLAQCRNKFVPDLEEDYEKRRHSDFFTPTQKKMAATDQHKGEGLRYSDISLRHDRRSFVT